MIITHQTMIAQEKIVDEIWLMGGVNKWQGQNILPAAGWKWQSGSGRNPGCWYTKDAQAVTPFVGKCEIVEVSGPVSVSGGF